MKDNFYKQLMEQSPAGYAYHKTICDQSGKPCDYSFIEVNQAFESLTGWKGSDIVGKRITEVMPDRVGSEFNWIDFYGEVALKGEPQEFEQFSEHLNRWYRVYAYSPEKGYFITVFSDISSERRQIKELEKLTTMIESYLQSPEEKPDYQKISEYILEVSGARFAAFNLYDEDGKHFTTMALAGVRDIINRATGILDMQLERKRWTHDQERADKIKDAVITRFADLRDLAGGLIPEGIITLLTDNFNLGETFVVKILKNNTMLGDFTLIMEKNKEFNNYSMVELYAKQVGLVISKIRAEETSNMQKNVLKAQQELSLDGILVADADGHIISYNQRFSDIWGIPDEIMTTQSTDNALNFVLPMMIDSEAFAQKVYQLSRNRQKKSHGEVILKDGRVLECYSAPITGNDQHYYGRVWYYRDITDRKEAEEAIRQRAEEIENISLEYEKVFNSTQDAMFLVSVSGEEEFNYIRNNRAHQRLTGFSYEELRGKTPEELFGNETGKLISLRYRECYDTKIPVTYEESLELSGEIRTWLTTLNPVQHDERMGYMVGSSIDITERKKMEKRLKENERYLRTILETTQDGFWVIGGQGQIADVNEAYCQMTGYTKTELLGMKINDLEALETPQETAIHIKWVIENGSDLFETRHRKKDGSFFDVEISVAHMAGDDGMLVCFCRDITERKQAEANRRQGEARLHAIITHSPLLISEFDTDGRYLLANPATAGFFGLLPQEMVGKTFSELLPLETCAVFMERIARIQATLSPIMVEDIMQVGEEVRYFITTLFPLHDDRELLSIGSIAHDITKQKRQEQQLYLEKEKFKTTLLSVGDGVISTDDQGNVVIMNKISEQLTGWLQEEAFGKPVEEVFNIINERTRERCENPVQKVLETGDIIELANHTHLISRDGSERPIEDSAAPIKDEQGNVTGVVLVFRDFTEKKKSQDEIKYLSLHDHLTGLYNRRYFDEELKRLDTERNWPLTIVIGDVNGLKLINDSFGHATGDDLLIKAAETIKKGGRADDIIARIGGDEFAILLPKTDCLQAEQLIRRMKNLLKKERVGDIEVSTSFGYGCKKSEADEIEAIFKNAEDMMYHNKLFEGPSIRGKVIDSIVDALHKKSKRERDHSKRVSELCERIGIVLGLREDKTRELLALGLLHDIGKIAVADDILNKPAQLSDSERTEMKRHSEIGYRILSTANDMSEITEYVLAHHERWDGKGYPKGLKGKTIPLESRILAIADAYDAMTSERGYKSSLTKEVALEELRNNAGTQFDPELVNVFLEMVLPKLSND
jgi:diguanylate cyclase